MRTLQMQTRCELPEADKQRLHSMLEKELKYQRHAKAYKDRIEKDYQRKRIQMIAKAERQKAILDESLERTMTVIQWEYQWELDNLETFCQAFLKKNVYNPPNPSYEEQLWSSSKSLVSQDPTQDEQLLIYVFIFQYHLLIAACLGLIWKGVMT